MSPSPKRPDPGRADASLPSSATEERASNDMRDTSFAAKLRSALPDLKYDASIWRRAMRAGAVHGPDAFVRLSPPMIGAAFALALPEVRKKVERSIAKTAGRPSGTWEAIRVFASYAQSLTESFAVGSDRGERMRARIVGDEHYQAAKSLGRGVLVATAHTSGWYAAGPVLGSVYDDEVLIVMQNERDAAAQAIQEATRSELGVRVVNVGADPLAAMPLVSHLKRRGIVALQMDRVPPGQRSRTVSVDGNDFEIPDGPLVLAGLTKAPIVVVLARRVSFLSYEIEVSEMVRVESHRDEIALGHAAREIAQRISAYVKRHPTSWFHFG